MARTVDPHAHSFALSEWPFSEPVNTLAYTTSRALRDGQPFLLVSHDHDGDWQFLCGDVADEEEGLIICLGCAYTQDKSLAKLAKLPAGWQAIRSSPADPWETYPYGRDDDDD
jgi:hypothetical protein